MTALTLALCVLAQVQVQIQLPQLVFPAPPQLVVVEPGLQVVEDFDDEVFFVDNYYWNRRDGRWFRAKDHRGGWVVVDAPLVPPLLVRQPAGKFRRFHRVVAPQPPPGAAVRVAPAPAPAPPPPPAARRDDDDDDDDDDRGNGKGKNKGKGKSKGKGRD